MGTGAGAGAGDAAPPCDVWLPAPKAKGSMQVVTKVIRLRVGYRLQFQTDSRGLRTTNVKNFRLRFSADV